MGRGRQKAKATKVARRLKYNTTATDLDRLRAELGVPSHPSSDDENDGTDDSYDEFDEGYAPYADDDGYPDKDGEGGDAQGPGRG